MLATVLHYSEPDAEIIDLVIPPLLLIILGSLLTLLYRRPLLLRPVISIGFGCAMLGTLIPIWLSVFRALFDSQISLVDSLPPVGPTLLPIMLFLCFFLYSDRVVLICLIYWLLAAGPILGYLFTHPAELWTPRGIDLVIILGPTILVTMALIPMQRMLFERMLRLQREHSHMQSLAERDMLTGAYNRRAGMTFLKRSLDRAQANTAIIMFDIDYFKAINDNYGHGVGDTVLQEVTRRCKQRLRRTDLLVRWGGEEFLVIIDDEGAANIRQLAEQLRKVIAAFPIGPLGIVSASFGFAQAHSNESVGELLDQADKALYHAKKQGRNRVVG